MSIACPLGPIPTASTFFPAAADKARQRRHPKAAKAAPEWSEEDIVQLHCILLEEIEALSDPRTPLAEKFDTLCWIFTDPDKDRLPFSFANCLRVACCSPLSTFPYVGMVDIEEIRDQIRHRAKAWLEETLLRYPGWVHDAVLGDLDGAAQRLVRKPQSLNKQLRRIRQQGDLFA